MALITRREAYPRDGAQEPIRLVPDRAPHGTQVASADTNLHRLATWTGTNTATNRNTTDYPRGQSIRGITQANPGVVTCTAHGLMTGDIVTLGGISGMTELNGQTVTVTRLTADTFSIGINTTGYTAYTSGGVMILSRPHFQLTGIDTTNGLNCFAGWILEITTGGYEQKIRILGNTAANPGVAELEEPPPRTLPATGNLSFLVYPEVMENVSVHLDEAATGTLTLYRAGSSASVLNIIDRLGPNQSTQIPAHWLKHVYYAFSANLATEVFWWKEAGDGGGVVGNLLGPAAGLYLDDSAFGIATDRVGAVGMLRDDSRDTIDDHDIGIPIITDDRRQITSSEAPTATAFANATDFVSVIGGVFDDAAPELVAEGQISKIRSSADGSLHVQIRNSRHGSGVNSFSTHPHLETHLLDGGDPANILAADALSIRWLGSRAGVAYNTLVTDDAQEGAIRQHGDLVTTAGWRGTTVVGYEAKDFDNAALPNSVDEGDAVRPAASLSGVQYIMPVSEDGSQSPYDPINNVLNIIEQNPVHLRADYQELQAATTITAANTQIGGNIDVTNYNSATFIFDYVDGDETSYDVSFYGAVASGGTFAQMGNWSVGANAVFDPNSYRVGNNANATVAISLDISDYTHIQVWGDSTGGTPTGTAAISYRLSKQ